MAEKVLYNFSDFDKEMNDSKFTWNSNLKQLIELKKESAKMWEGIMPADELIKLTDYSRLLRNGIFIDLEILFPNQKIGWEN